MVGDIEQLRAIALLSKILVRAEPALPFQTQDFLNLAQSGWSEAQVTDTLSWGIGHLLNIQKAEDARTSRDYPAPLCSPRSIKPKR